MSITDERRAELIEMLRSASDQSSTTVALFRPADARDILAMLKEGEGEDAPAPTITFKPYEPPKPTLDQMPYSEFHKVAKKASTIQPIQWLCHTAKGEVAHEMSGGGGVREAWVADASQYTVLDADPPEPKKLADVPDLCIVESHNGKLYSKWDNRAWLRSPDNLLEYSHEDANPQDITITRVLGFPQID